MKPKADWFAQNGISREKIIETIGSALCSEDHIVALWLEGSDGTQSLDEYSDIDLVCYAKEGHADYAVSRMDDILKSLGTLDLVYEQPGRPANNRYKVYHLRETPESLLIDVTFQSQSFPVAFLHEDQTVLPKVLLDKADVVTFKNVDIASFRSQLRNQLTQAKGIYSQRSRAVKYTKRGLFLEALIYYQKYVLHPLVEVLRIVHTPFQADCFLVHATRAFPAEVVAVLESLYGVKTVDEIAERIVLAEELFEKAVVQANESLEMS